MVIVAALFALLIAVLAIPVSVHFRLSSKSGAHNDVRVEWAFGLVKSQVTDSRSSQRRAREKKKTKKWAEHGHMRLRALLRQKRLFRRILRFLRDLWRAVKKRDVELRLRVGLGDPADTGRLWAVLGPVAGMLHSVKDASINVVPDFYQTTLDADSSGSVRVIPLQLLGLLFVLMLSPALWRGVLALRGAGS